MIERRNHGSGFTCAKCSATVYITTLSPPAGLCDMCSVAYDFRGCPTCKGHGTVKPLPGGHYMLPCPTCMTPALPGEERCEHAQPGLRCCLRKGHWAWASTGAVNGHNFIKEP